MHLFLIKIVALSFVTCYIYIMKKVKRCYDVLSSLSPGELYSWDNLKEYSNSPGRDIKRLVDEGLLKKVGPGLYLVPKKGRFGDVPLTEAQLVGGFLKTDDFLMFSTTQYNALGLGLTQLKNEFVVYNHKRHETVFLAGRVFHFKRPNNFFPDKLTKEFLLLDLMNNIKSFGESEADLKEKVVSSVNSGEFNVELLLSLVNKYGKVGTRKFFDQLNLGNNYPHKRVA